LGPSNEKGQPDLRNLDVFMALCEKGDIIMFCTDGVHDNFDPQSLGRDPSEFGFAQEKWDEADPSEVNKCKILFRKQMLNEKIQEIVNADASIHLSCDALTDTLIDHCSVTLKNSISFMEDIENRGKRLPSDYKLYPGKMDHTTAFSFRVGTATKKDFVQSKLSKPPAEE
jgi:hypothetical protein